MKIRNLAAAVVVMAIFVSGCRNPLYTAPPAPTNTPDLTETAIATLWTPTYTPTATPTGNRIVFASNRDDANAEVYSMNESGGNIIRLTNRTGIDWDPAWSPDRSKILFNRDVSSIFTMNADGSNVTWLASGGGADWSPDGTRIVYEIGNPGDVWVMNADASGQTRLTYSSQPEGEAKWSPDGSKILFVRWIGSGFQLFTMNPDGNNIAQLTFDARIHEQPAWSPDGTKIAYMTHQSSWGTPYSIWTMNADGSNQREITGLGNWDPNLSPDGSKIIFMSNRDGRHQLYTMNADGTNQVRLISSAYNDAQPDWK